MPHTCWRASALFRSSSSRNINVSSFGNVKNELLRSFLPPPSVAPPPDCSALSCDVCCRHGWTCYACLVVVPRAVGDGAAELLTGAKAPPEAAAFIRQRDPRAPLGRSIPLCQQTHLL